MAVRLHELYIAACVLMEPVCACQGKVGKGSCALAGAFRCFLNAVS